MYLGVQSCKAISSQKINTNRVWLCKKTQYCTLYEFQYKIPLCQYGVFYLSSSYREVFGAITEWPY